MSKHRPFVRVPTSTLIRSALVLRAIQCGSLLRHAELISSRLEWMFGKRAHNLFIRSSIFATFCAGDNESSAYRTARQWSQFYGVAPILDPSIESSCEEDGEERSWRIEKAVDRYSSSIRILADLKREQQDISLPSFIAVKPSGLCPPSTLLEISTALSTLSLEEKKKLFLSSANSDIQSSFFSKLSGGDRKHAEYFFEFIDSVARLCQEARDCSGSNVLLDAEVSSLQPAVDLAGFWIQKLMNSRDSVGGGLLYQTFQCYRKDTPLRIDMYLSWVQECDSFIPALKIVRGAYMIQERQNAKQKRQPDIICDTIDETHAQYDSIAHKLVEYMLQDRSRIALFFGTHNENSILRIQQHVESSGLSVRDFPIAFAQLLGISDGLTLRLADSCIPVCKLFVYGSVDEVFAWLLRRAYENSSAMGGISRDLPYIQNELWIRFKSIFPSF